MGICQPCPGFALLESRILGTSDSIEFPKGWIPRGCSANILQQRRCFAAACSYRKEMSGVDVGKPPCCIFAHTCVTES